MYKICGGQGKVSIKSQFLDKSNWYLKSEMYTMLSLHIGFLLSAVTVNKFLLNYVVKYNKIKL
jgi:hypothetical protein